MIAKDKLGISLVGCGIISEIQAAAIKQSQNARLISVYSRNPENARRVGEKFDVPWSSNWENFIENKNMDLVSICTPSGNHLDYGKLAAMGGKHVVVEKPIEVTLERGKQLIDVCKANGIKLAVIFQNRFVPDIQNMKKSIDEGAIGNLFFGDAYIKWFRAQSYYNSAPWRGTIELDGGGVLINQAIHTIDLLRWMMGDVKTVYGQIDTFTHKRIEAEDNAAGVLRFENGALGVIAASTSVQPAMARRLEIHGTKGTVIVDNNLVTFQTGQTAEKVAQKKKTGELSGAKSPLQGYSLLPHQRQFEAIVDALKNDTNPPLSGEEALKSLEIVLAIYDSSNLGKPISVSNFLKEKIG